MWPLGLWAYIQELVSNCLSADLRRDLCYYEAQGPEEKRITKPCSQTSKSL